MHAISILETSPADRKIHHSSIWSKTQSYFFPGWDISTFKRPFSPFSMQKVVSAISSAETCRAARKIHSIRRFDRKLSVISFPFEIFRRLNAHFTPFYTQSVVRAISILETSPAGWKTQSLRDFTENWALCRPRLRYLDVETLIFLYFTRKT